MLIVPHRNLAAIVDFIPCTCMLTFQGGGYWQPDAATLAKLRNDIDRKPHKIKSVLRNHGIRKEFLGGVPDDDRKAVKAFTSSTTNQSNALKRNPKVSDEHFCDVSSRTSNARGIKVSTTPDMSALP